MTHLTPTRTVRALIASSFLLIIIMITSACAPAGGDADDAIVALPTVSEPVATPTLMPTATADSSAYPIDSATEAATVEPTEAATEVVVELPTKSAETPPATELPTNTPPPTQPDPTETPFAAAPAVEQLLENEQTLFLTELSQDGVVTQLFPAEVSMTIDWTGGMVNGNAGCNSFGGTFTVDAGSVAIGSLATTRMACEESIMALERQVLTLLEMGTSIEISARHAVISSSAGQLVFGQTANSVGGSRPTNQPNLAPVDSFDIAMLESFPVQATMTVRGSFADACWRVSKVEQDVFQQEAIFVTLEMERVGEVCAQVITPFEEVVDLKIRGLKAGTYRVVVNGVEGSLVLSVDNIVTEEE